MAMQQSLSGSLRGSLRSSLQSVNLVWKKEKATLERRLQYFDESGATIVLVWNHKRSLYEGTAEMSLGRHSGSLFISDQGLEPTHLFEVDKQEIGVVQEILLLINRDPVFPDPCSTPVTPTVPFLPPLGDSTPTDSDSLDPVPLDHKLIHSRPPVEPLHSDVNGEKELEAEPAVLELTKENTRLQDENISLAQQYEQARREKQLIKQESFEIDEQLVSALESVSAYQQKQTLMDERYNAFTREARIMEETNQGMKLRINEMEIKAARDHETFLQMQLDLGSNSEQIQKMYDERDTLFAKYNCLEQSLATTERREIAQIQEVDRTLEKERLGRETEILRENCEKMRHRDIPSLQRDVEELKRQLFSNERRHQGELQLATQERDNFKRELAVSGAINPDGRKRIDQLDGAENESRDPMALMDKLSHHFDDCSASLRVLVQLLEATVAAKDSQLDRRSGELRDARIRNDRLVEEVVSRGHQISSLTDRLQSIASKQAPLQSARHIIEEIDREIDPSMEPAALPEPSRDQGANPANVTLPSPADLIKYEPGIKSLYRGLTNITNKLIDFTDTPVSVSMMNYLEDPKTHIGNQVICMIHGNYLIGMLRIVFQFRPSVSGLGALSPITYAGIEFDAPVGTSNGSFKGVAYFECRENHAEYTSLENVYIHV